MKIKIHSEIDQIPADSWNKLVKDNNPFVRHEFLSALENNNCVGTDFGWLPCHIAIYDEQSDKENHENTHENTNVLIGAMPLYQKTNSYGEFVFDHAWADAYQRNGLAYFPKLVSSIPYTPASGQRLLASDACRDITPEAIYMLLIQTVKQFAREHNISSFHCLFPEEGEQRWMEQQGLLTRNDCQFHWFNQEYQTFDEFLEKLTPKKRKNIRQERRRVEQQAINLRILNGHTATAKDWQNFAAFYNQTFLEKSGYPTLNEGFFSEIARKLPEQTLLILADNQQGKCIAGSLMYASDSRLYGRHWGSIEHIDKLHFEACYYQGIEFCIRNKLQVFEPGAQGEHKIARGFIPTLTKSSHWLNNSPFEESIANFVKHEQDGVAHYINSLKSPYKNQTQ